MTRTTPSEFDREKWQAECHFRERELTLREREQQVHDAELEIRRQESGRSRWSNPLVLAILAAAGSALVATIGTFANIYVALFNANEQRVGEAIQAQAAQLLEDRKAESARILELIKGDPDTNAQNFQFLIDSGLIRTREIVDPLTRWLNSRRPGQGPSAGSVTYRSSAFECTLKSDAATQDVTDKLLSVLKGPPFAAGDIDLIKSGNATHAVATISFPISESESMKGILDIVVSEEKPWTMETETGEPIGSSSGGTTVKGFIDGLLLNRKTGALTSLNKNAVVTIDWRLGDLISNSLGGCSEEEWR